MVNGAFATASAVNGFTRVPLKVTSDGTLNSYSLSTSQRRTKAWNGTGVAYTAGDVIGGKLSLSNVFNFGESTNWLMDLMILDLDAQAAALRVLFFDRDPTAATLTDNAALALSTDAANITAYVDILASDYVTVETGKSLAQIWNINLPLATSDVTIKTLYFAIIAVGTPNYTNGKGIQLTLGIRVN